MPNVTTPTTLPALFNASAIALPERQVLSAKVGDGWLGISYSEAQRAVSSLAISLFEHGIRQGERVAILSENRPEWVIADLAVLSLGAITVPIYPTLPASYIRDILCDSGAKAVFASDTAQLGKVRAITDLLPELSLIVAFEDQSDNVGVFHFSELANRTDTSLALPKAQTVDIAGDDLASLVYTSGTTGVPKGAMLTHNNFLSEIESVLMGMPLDHHGEVFLSFLPLCHIYERVTLYVALSLGAHIYFTESVFKVQQNLEEVKPDLMQSVPRLFEAIHERVLDTVSKAPAPRQKIFHFAISSGVEFAKQKQARKFVGPVLALNRFIADKLVLRKLRARLGGRLKFMVSGGAPLRVETADFFQGIGIPILEGYGLTETTAAVTINPYGRAVLGTVGPVMSGTSLKIAGDGEILSRGQQ